jgi:hypothetical protein
VFYERCDVGTLYSWQSEIFWCGKVYYSSLLKG